MFGVFWEKVEEVKEKNGIDNEMFLELIYLY